MNNLSLRHIAQGFVGLLLLIAFVWLAFYMLIFVLVLAAGVTVFLFARRLLVKYGIIKAPIAPEPSQPPAADDAPIIETDYTDVTEAEEKTDE